MLWPNIVADGSPDAGRCDVKEVSFWPNSRTGGEGTYKLYSAAQAFFRYSSSTVYAAVSIKAN